MRRLTRLLLLFGIAVALFAPRAQAQIKVTESDARALVGKRLATQVIVAKTPSSFSSFFNQSGEGLTFDFTPYQYELAFSGSQEGWKASNAPTDIPFLSRFTDRGANVVYETRYESQQTTKTDSTFWQFLEITSTEESLVGFTALFSQDLDQDGEQPDSVWAEWTPARITATLPLTYDDKWSQGTDLSYSVAALPSLSSDRESKVDAYGTLKTPVGSAPALRIREETVDTTSIAGFQEITRSTVLQFITKDGRLGASITRDDDTGEITNASITVRAGDGEVFAVSQGSTPTLSGVSGVEISFTDGSTAAGTLGVSRFNTPPFNNTFTGSATSDDGSSVTPNVVWKGRYFTVQNEGLSNFTAEVCIDIGAAPGVSDVGKLVLLAREAADKAWSPLDSSVDGDKLCASVSSFSQFAVGANSNSNPLPVELAQFDAQVEGRRAHLSWQTVSETKNAGFEVLHRSERTNGWQAVDFVESKAGGGTTTTSTEYQFRTDPLSVGTHQFRLRQKDVDGTTTPSDPVSVEIQMQKALHLTAPVPNPATQETSVRFGTKEATHAEVAVYDVLGRRVRTLHRGPIQPGEMREVRMQTVALPAGIYFVRMQADGKGKTRRLTVVR